MAEMGYYNDTTHYDYKWHKIMGNKEEYDEQTYIIKYKYEKPDLNELDKK